MLEKLVVLDKPLVTLDRLVFSTLNGLERSFDLDESNTSCIT